jgi:hypothetical protein
LQLLNFEYKPTPPIGSISFRIFSKFNKRTTVTKTAKKAQNTLKIAFLVNVLNSENPEGC